MTTSTFWPALRVFAVIVALFGSVSLTLRSSQQPSTQSQKPQAPPEKPDQPDQQAAPAAEEQAPEDAAKPSEDVPKKTNTQPPAAAAEEPAVNSTAPTQLFHGTITHFTSEFVTVSRALVGKRPESRRFLILKTTKVHRALRVRAKVTVRYKHLPQGDVALEIQIHPIYAQKS